MDRISRATRFTLITSALCLVWAGTITFLLLNNYQFWVLMGTLFGGTMCLLFWIEFIDKRWRPLSFLLVNRDTIRMFSGLIFALTTILCFLAIFGSPEDAIADNPFSAFLIWLLNYRPATVILLGTAAVVSGGIAIWASLPRKRNSEETLDPIW